MFTKPCGVLWRQPTLGTSAAAPPLVASYKNGVDCSVSMRRSPATGASHLLADAHSEPPTGPLAVS